MVSWQGYLIKKFMRLGVKPNLKSATLDSARETMDSYVERFMPKPPRQLEITAVDCSRFHGERIQRKGMKGTRSVLYLHGGGFVSASAQTHRGITCALAMENVGIVWAPNYPLAPEHSLPEIERSCLHAYDHLVDMGIAPASIAIAGDQAGAWLATKLVINLRRARKPLPGALALLSPFLDPTLSGDSFVYNRDADPLSDFAVAGAALEMVFKDMDRESPECCLLHADLKHFPPVLIQSSDIDLIVDDARRMATALEAQGQKVRLEIWKDVPPLWHLFVPALPEAKAAIKSAARFITQHLDEKVHQDSRTHRMEVRSSP